jgi:transcriptional regulator with XRE-family HTH domain
MRRRRPEREQHYISDEYVTLQALLAANVRALRAQSGWSQEQAAEACGMATRLLQRVEAGDANTTMATLARLCAGFAVEPSRLFERPRAD